MASNVTADMLRAKLLENQNKGRRDDGQKQSSGDNASFPFWNAPKNTESTVRFLPDGNPDNMFFWEKREVIKLPFQGVVGGDYPTDKRVEVTIPCVDMFGMSCPITAHIRPWWQDEAKKPLARVYYKKKSYLFQGFVVQSAFEEQNVPENPIRRLVLNPSLYEIVEQSLMNPEMEDLPIDYVNGRDFKIKKTEKGEYANYQTSTWSFRTRSLGEPELLAIEQHGLFKLKDYLGRVPDADEMEAIKAMFQESLDGKPFDMASFGKYYRPYGSRDGNNDADAVTQAARTAMATGAVAAPVQETVRETVAAPAATQVAEAAPADQTVGKASVNDILARIKDRANKGE